MTLTGTLCPTTVASSTSLRVLLQSLLTLSSKESGDLFYLDGTVDSELAYHGGAGGLLLFPSYMIHASAPNSEDVDRYSIAFNTFPSGDINLGGHGLPMARVKTEGWKNLGPLNLDEYARD